MLSDLLSVDVRPQFEMLRQRLQPQAETYQMALKAQESEVKARFVTAPLQAVDFFGRSKGILKLTPKSIRYVPLETLKATQPEVVFEMDIAKVRRTSLETYSYTGSSGGFNTGIHFPHIAFPPFCIACLADVVSYQVVEVAVKKGSFGRWGVNTDQDTAERIAKAALYDRYWIALPFCATHARRLEGLDVSASGSIVSLAFGNFQYAALFQLLNPTLSGVYKSENCRRGEKMSHFILVPSLAVLAMGVLFMFITVNGVWDLSENIVFAGPMMLLGVLGIVCSKLVRKRFDAPVPFKVD